MFSFLIFIIVIFNARMTWILGDKIDDLQYDLNEIEELLRKQGEDGAK